MMYSSSVILLSSDISLSPAANVRLAGKTWKRTKRTTTMALLSGCVVVKESRDPCLFFFRVLSRPKCVFVSRQFN